MDDKSFRLRVGLAFGWLVFTSSLIVWWMYFALNLLESYDGASETHRRMLLWEGITLLLLLLIGGGVLIYFIFEEKKRSNVVRDFFSSFSHEVKTALASLRLQAESLMEDIKDEGSKRLLGRLVSDTSRVLVSVENSLYVGSGDYQKSTDFRSQVEWPRLEEELRLSWPQASIQVKSSTDLFVDQRGLFSIFQNLVHNSIHHGNATQVLVSVMANGAFVTLRVCDNGIGFQGDKTKLGLRGLRHGVASGSGLGLYIVGKILANLGGRGPYYPDCDQGFCVEFDLPQFDPSQESGL